MKIDRNLKKIVNKFVQASFDKRNNIIDERVQKYTKVLKLLPLQNAIYSLSEYFKKINYQTKKTSLTIESVVSLFNEQKNDLVKQFKTRQNISQVNFFLNPSLLGGLRVKISDWVYDDSIAQRINQLGKTING